jgi:hypothetical protein
VTGPVIIYCFCGDPESSHGQNGTIPCNCGCPRFILDTVDPRHDR